MSAMPVMLGVLCVMAIAYRYYSAFLAAKVAALNDFNKTPAVLQNDGQNYHPTSKWVLFGHHFAAISGAGPLIGPVLAAQFGYLPGLLWIVIGVCLAGAVQDFLVLVASMRRNGKSLAQIAFMELGPITGWAAMLAILIIIVIALAGLGKVVVKALGGEEVKFPPGSVLVLPGDMKSPKASSSDGAHDLLEIPAGTKLLWNDGKSSMTYNDSFMLARKRVFTQMAVHPPDGKVYILDSDARLVPGSPWGVFTIAATIPIALLVGLWMYKIRPGKTVEASIVGAALTLGAVFVGAGVADSHWGQIFNLSQIQVTWSMAIYGFIAAVLPVWVLLAPRDYLSSFLKIGTIGLLVIGTLIANPKLEAPAINHVFLSGGPTVAGQIFPFLFITIMCGAISGFHALVSSGTTPKMVMKESDARVIGYGAMLMEALVGVVAMIAAATLPVNDYYAMNTELAKVPQFHDKILLVGGGGGIEHIDPGAASRDGDNLPQYEKLTQESLRGRTGGAVTLAVGMAHIFDNATKRFVSGDPNDPDSFLHKMWKYWYHFAIMFEALFILTTIDAGTRVGRFLLQEILGKTVHRKLGETSWLPSALLSTSLIVLGWAYFMNTDSFNEIWKMFGIANQMLAVIALAVVTAVLISEGKRRYVWVTILPMLGVTTTTTTAALYMLQGVVTTLQTQLPNTHSIADFFGNSILLNTTARGCLILLMLSAAYIVIFSTMAKLILRPAPRQEVEVAKSRG